MIWLSRHWFLVGLAAVAALAFAWPEFGAAGGPLRPAVTTRVGVGVIFFLQGLIIAPAVLRTGALRWRLHLAVQLFVFVGFPVGMLLLDRTAGDLLNPNLRVGFLFLAILPTTISTCVVFTASAGGNTSGALFNSAFANVVGVLITPLWAALLLQGGGEGARLGSMLGEVALLLLLPLMAGQALRPLVRRRVEPNARVLSGICSGIILYIIYAAFANSAASGAFREMGPGATLGAAAVATVLFVLASAGAGLLGRWLGFDRQDRRALLFCAPQKTLAAGAPMAQVIFAGHPGLGLVLLPLILYHAAQLAGGAALAQRLGRGDRTG